MTPNPLIAIDCRMVNMSGIGTCIKGWLPHLIAQNPQWRFQLLGRPAELAPFDWTRAANVKITPFDSPIYSLREQWEWLKLRTLRFDLVWVPHFNIPLLWPGKLMVTVHDVIFLAMPELFSPIHRAYAKLFFGRIRARADAVFFDSSFTQDEFCRLVGKPKGAFGVIYIGVDRKWSEPLPGLPLPDAIVDRPYIVCVGNVKPNKNLPRLIAAFSEIVEEIPHRLVIVGKQKGFMTSDNRSETLAAKQGDRILFTGFVSDDMLRLLVGKADLMVFPSFYEGFGLPPLEALATGCPVVASNIPPIVEVLGDRAVLFDPYDEEDIAKTIKKMLGQKRNVSLSSLDVNKFDWSASARAIGLTMQRLNLA